MKGMILVAVGMGVLGCASVQTQGDYDTNYDFGSLRTWDWMPEPGTSQGTTGRPNPMVERRIEEAIERELAGKGYQRVQDGNPDFRVAFFASAQDKLDVSTTYDYYGYRWRTVAVPRTDVREYTEGTLIVDIVDGSLNDLVWRGTGTGTLRNASPEESTQRINDAVRDVLEDFPPR